MSSEIVIIIVQIIAVLCAVISVVYLAVQIHKQNEIIQAQSAHSLTQNVYERYFVTMNNVEFSELPSRR